MYHELKITPSTNKIGFRILLEGESANILLETELYIFC